MTRVKRGSFVVRVNETFLQRGEWMMRTSLKAILLMVAFLLSSAAIAAADYCLSIPGNTLVLKGFSLPGNGACKETRGFYSSFGPWWVTGMACGSSNGHHVTFFHTVVNSGGIFVSTEKFALNRATLSGTGTQCSIETGFGASCDVGSFEWTKVPCSPSPVPVP